jgi:transcriptional regulator with XRE-family HTH domain
MFSKEKFSKRVKELRTAKDVSQTAVATVLQVSRTQIGDIENGKSTTTIERLCMLADYFNVSLDYLTGRDECQPMSESATVRGDEEKK